MDYSSVPATIGPKFVRVLWEPFGAILDGVEFFSPRSTDEGITPVPLRTYQRHCRRVTSAPLWAWFWALVVYVSVVIITESYSPYFIMFIVFRLSPIGLHLSQFEEWEVLIRSNLSSLLYFVLLYRVQYLVTHWLCGKTLLFRVYLKDSIDE